MEYAAFSIISTAEHKVENSFSNILKTPSVNKRVNRWICQNKKNINISTYVNKITTTRTA